MKVENSQFSNNGGGGGTFYRGRPQKRREDDEAAPEQAVDAFEAADHALVPLPARQPSRLSLWTPRPVPAAPVDEDALLAELEAAVHGKLRVLQFAVNRMERDFARRQRAEVGEMVIGA